jgi:REP element-mobilizing transposase RayT
MPRGPRLDAPGVLHHVMVRGIEGRRIFRSDIDRDEFVRRLGETATAAGLTLFAWALLPNHAHLLLRTSDTVEASLAGAMRSLLTGYAGAFNRRHRRRGHLFQNRYKSIVVEEAPYFLELVRYIHLNPLRARVVPDLAALANYRYSGHAGLLGRSLQAWQAAEAVLAQFGDRRRAARAAYLAFVAAGVSRGRRPELQGGGLVRSLGGWTVVSEMRHGRERYAGDERILGSSAFVETLRLELEARDGVKAAAPPLDALIQGVCRATGIAREVVCGRGRPQRVSRAREGIAFLWTVVAGQSGRELASALGVTPQAIHSAARRGARRRAEWLEMWKKE